MRFHLRPKHAVSDRLVRQLNSATCQVTPQGRQRAACTLSSEQAATKYHCTWHCKNSPCHTALCKHNDVQWLRRQITPPCCPMPGPASKLHDPKDRCWHGLLCSVCLLFVRLLLLFCTCVWGCDALQTLLSCPSFRDIGWVCSCWCARCFTRAHTHTTHTHTHTLIAAAQRATVL